MNFEVDRGPLTIKVRGLEIGSNQFSVSPFGGRVSKGYQ